MEPVDSKPKAVHPALPQGHFGWLWFLNKNLKSALDSPKNENENPLTYAQIPLPLLPEV